MRIRELPIEEHQRTRPLYEEVFAEDGKNFVDYYYTEKTKDNQIYVLEEDGDIQAMLHLNPYMLMVNGAGKEACYIVAVATREEYRGRGYMGALLREALRAMYGRGQCFTFLMPAAEAIYTPYDFRTVYEQDLKRCPVAREGEVVMEDRRVCQVAEAKDSDLPELARAANEALSSGYQVYALRSEAYYRRLMKEYKSEGARLMVYRREGQITDCRPWIPEEDSGKAKPKIMARILDVRRMLMSVGLRTLTAVCFTVTDPVIEENNRCLVVTGTEFSGVMLMDGKPENSEGVISVAALTSLLFGAGSVDEIRREEGVEMSERMAGELEKLIPLSRICLNEAV